MSEQDESRTFGLDKEILRGICSPSTELRNEAIYELPDALTSNEISDIAIQLSLLPGAKAINEGRKMETDGLFYIGANALFLKQDIVTAENVARELRRNGLMGIVGSLLLKNEIRKTKKEIITTLTE
ncbi:hypothetical protein KW803_02540 [Candidatus Saccharibacteria bacterium]|nr:hypothetical protein [Candidatus Saccharibacteria bacterium]